MTIYRQAARLAETLPAMKIASAAREIASIPADGVTKAKLEAAWGTAATKPSIAEFCAVAAQASLSGGEIAAALRAASETMNLVRNENQVDLIWTGPQTSAIPVRRNEQAMCELIDGAKKELFIVSFVAVNAKNVYASINKAISRGVKVSFLAESSIENGGTLDTSDPVTILHEKFPSATCYRWSCTGSAKKHCVHVKCAVADGGVALVTSANLTGAAMDTNMELGVLIRSKEIAGKLAAHLTALVDENIIKAI